MQLAAHRLESGIDNLRGILRPELRRRPWKGGCEMGRPKRLHVLNTAHGVLLLLLARDGLRPRRHSRGLQLLGGLYPTHAAGTASDIHSFLGKLSVAPTATSLFTARRGDLTAPGSSSPTLQSYQRRQNRVKQKVHSSQCLCGFHAHRAFDSTA
jgi:hypothetical protein